MNFIFWSELKETLELRLGIALITQYKLTVAGVAQILAAAPCKPAIAHLEAAEGREQCCLGNTRRF